MFVNNTFTFTLPTPARTVDTGYDHVDTKFWLYHVHVTTEIKIYFQNFSIFGCPVSMSQILVLGSCLMSHIPVFVRHKRNLMCVSKMHPKVLLYVFFF